MHDKNRILECMRKFHEKNDPTRVKRRNKAPEKAVQTEVMAWLNSKGFDCNVFESKAVFSASANRYLHSQMKPGVVDIIGNDPNGHAVFIELKAPGRINRSSLRAEQRLFLLRKIETYAFACVVDSSKRLEEIYSGWKAIDVPQRRDFLKSTLP